MFRIITDATQFREHVLLRDGESVLLRMAAPADVPAVEALLRRVSSDSLRLRFMGGVRQVPRQFVENLCSLDARDRACMLAVVGEEAGERVVGFGDYVASGVRHTAEVAFLVEDSYQGRGVTTLLLEKLAGIAAGAGFVGFEADVLFENQRMLSVFRDSGFVGHQVVEGGSYHLDFPVSGAAALRAPSGARAPPPRRPWRGCSGLRSSRWSAPRDAAAASAA
jgi:GNAT superfamily N-acetyltransferase